MKKSPFLKRMSTLNGASEPTLRYYKWLHDACEKVDLLRYTTSEINQGLLIDEKEILRYNIQEKEIEFFKSVLKFIKINPIKNKNCFKVASLACLSLDEVSYIEGYLEFPNVEMGVEYAWNQYKDLFYFDLLSTYSPKKPLPTYYKILTVTKSDLRRILNEEKTSYPLMREFYNKQVWTK